MTRFLAAAVAMALATAVAISANAGPFHVGITARVANSDSAALRNHGDRTIRLTVWYPAATSAVETPFDIGPPDAPIFHVGAFARDAAWGAAGRRPLVLVSHGFGGAAMQMTWLAAELARHGYVVVGVDHPGTNGRDGVTAEGAYSPWERVGDIRAALDAVLADPQLGPHIDPARIGMAGFSLGGFTTVLEAGGRPDFDRFLAFCASPQRDAICDPQKEFPVDMRQQAAVLARPEMAEIAARRGAVVRDPRIRAGFLIAPAIAKAVDPASLAAIRIPIAVVQGDADHVAPTATNGVLYARAIPGATLKLLPGVGHYDYLSECAPAGLKFAADYCADAPGVSRAKTHATTAAAALAFFDRTLK